MKVHASGPRDKKRVADCKWKNTKRTGNSTLALLFHYLVLSSSLNFATVRASHFTHLKKVTKYQKQLTQLVSFLNPISWLYYRLKPYISRIFFYTLNIIIPQRGTCLMVWIEVVIASIASDTVLQWPQYPSTLEQSILFCFPVVWKLSILLSGLNYWYNDLTIFSELQNIDLSFCIMLFNSHFVHNQVDKLWHFESG